VATASLMPFHILETRQLFSYYLVLLQLSQNEIRSSACEQIFKVLLQTGIQPCVVTLSRAFNVIG